MNSLLFLSFILHLLSTRQNQQAQSHQHQLFFKNPHFNQVRRSRKPNQSYQSSHQTTIESECFFSKLPNQTIAQHKTISISQTRKTQNHRKLLPKQKPPSPRLMKRTIFGRSGSLQQKVVMGNECEVCNKSEDDSNRRNQVSLKLSDEQKTSQPTHNALPGKQNQPFRPSLSKKDEEYFNQVSAPEKNNTFKTSGLHHSKPEPELIEKREPVRFKNGVVYTGDWKDNARHGYGVQVWPDGAKYEGYWENGKATGKGKFVHVDGDIYEGDWKEDKACGYGIYKHNNGARYDGEWFDDYQHGYGIQTWADGSKYEGYYKQGKKNGEGKYIWKDGSFYEGSWEDNKITGYGIYIWADGRRYKGEWLNNQMHGRGEYTWKDGRKYEGEYVFDKKHGLGSYTWADGRKYVGEWANSKRNGKGKIISVDGSEREGIWEEDKRVRWVDEGASQFGNSNMKTTISKVM